MSRPSGPQRPVRGAGAVPSAEEVLARRRRTGSRRRPTGGYAPGAGGAPAPAASGFDYAAAADRLKAARREIPAAFSRPHAHPAGCLFHFCSPDRRAHWLHEHRLAVGCPVQVSSRTHYVAWGRDCTRRILGLRLPADAARLSDGQLDELADLQTEMDLTFRSRKWREDFPLAMVATWPGDRVAEEEEDSEWF